MSRSKPPADQLRAMRRAGYRIGARRGDWLTKTFEVEAARLKEFLALVDKENFLIKEALDQALAAWIARYSVKKKGRP